MRIFNGRLRALLKKFNNKNYEKSKYFIEREM